MKNWEHKTLEEICEVITDFVAAGSFADLRKNVEYKSDPDYAQLIRTTDLKHNFNNKDFVYVSKSAFEYLYRVNMNEESLVLPNVGNCGEIYYVSTDIFPYERNVLGPNAVLVRSHSVNNKFLFYYFLSSKFQFQLNDITSRMAQPKFNKTKLKTLIVDIPPLEEQKRIVKILDEKFTQLETVKENAKTNLQNAKDLFQSQLTKAFSNTTWEKKRLGDVCSITSRLVDPTLPEYLDLYHVGGANIESETGVIIDLKTSKEEGLSSGKFTFDETMVLYNKIRPYLKKVARPDFNGLCSADMYPLSPKDNITKDYLYYVLTSDDFTEYAISKSGRAGMPKVNREALFAYECYLPPLPEQKRIVEQLDSLNEKVRSLEEIYTKQLANCDELKQAFLAKAFAGEL